MKRIRLFDGNAASDASALALVKLMTMLLSLVTTRVLSTCLSTFAYGTYSQILLVVSTVTSITTFGLMDAVNYYYCSTYDSKKREAYTATIYTIQCCVSSIAGIAILLLASPICNYFGNDELHRYLIFAAFLPLLQNSISLLQVLFVSVGKARQLAVRNLVISLAQLMCAIAVGFWLQEIGMILAVTVVLDIGQIAFFIWSLKVVGCCMPITSCDIRLTGSILRYSIPMAIFTVVNTLNRDMDKYMISAVSDTETLAVYSNAAKVLPFDIILTSFMTVLLPHITRQISERRYNEAVETYRAYLEVSYISTALLAFSVLSAAPQAMELLYSEKYLTGIPVFCIYIVVDIFRFASITLILSASGKTKLLMRLGFAALASNVVLNYLLYQVLGIAGPALATLLVSLGLGFAILHFSAKEIHSSIRQLFDCRFLLKFTLECLCGLAVFSLLQQWMSIKGLHYFIVLLTIVGGYMVCAGLPNLKRFIIALKQISSLKSQ